MNKQQLIQSKEVEILYSQAKVSIIAVQTAATMFIFAMLDYADRDFLLAWLVVFSAISLVRYILVPIYFKSINREKHYRRWKKLFLVGTTLSGALWGIFACLVLPVADPNYTALTILVISGLVGGSIGAYAISRSAYFTYASASILPLAFVLLQQNDRTLIIFGAIVVIYYLFMAAIMFRLSPMVKQGVNLQFENIDLLRELEAEKQIISTLNQELETDIEKRKETAIELLEAKDRAEDLAATLARLSVQDGLTGITNRRGFDEFMAEAWSRASRHQSPISLIMCDVDYFKGYNDFYGHPAGDDVLKKLASTIEQRLRKGCDLVARYGGEEFVIVLPDTAFGAAFIVAEKVRIAIEQLSLIHEKSEVSQSITVSAGIACAIPETGMHSPFLIGQADEALYSAKAAGRNRTYPSASIEVSSSSAAG